MTVGQRIGTGHRMKEAHQTMAGRRMMVGRFEVSRTTGDRCQIHCDLGKRSLHQIVTTPVFDRHCHHGRTGLCPVVYT